MAKSYNLRSHDLCVLLQVILDPGQTFRELASAVGLSLGEAHNSKKRLEVAGLLTENSGRPNTSGALELLFSGVPYVFPGKLGAETRGVPTAHSAPPLVNEVRANEVVVWPSAQGTARGFALEPLCPCAPETSRSNQELYRLLTLVDALRIGRARERQLAREYLTSALQSARQQWPQS